MNAHIPRPTSEPSAESFCAPPARVTIDAIKRATCQHFGIEHRELVGPYRSTKYVVPRQIAMFLARELTINSFPQISSRFADRDHTTALHAWRKISARRGEFEQDIEAIKQRLEGDK